MFRFFNLFLVGVDTDTTTLTECIPTIVAAALLELEEGNVVAPLVTDVPFPGPGVSHQSPIIQKLAAEASDGPTAQAMDSGSGVDPSPRTATVGVHSAYVLLKDIAALGSVGDMAAVAGQLIGQCLVTRRDLDLVSLFSSFTTNQGAGTTTLSIAPADLYDAYGSLRKYHAPLPYHLVLHPSQIWSSHGLIALFDNSSDAIQSRGLGTVGEDWARSGYSGMVMGFNLWSDTNIVYNTANGSGLAFSREAIKNVRKRDFMLEIQRSAPVVGDNIVGSEIRGESILRESVGNEMQFTSLGW
jgi:hypothetical protein